MSKLNCTGKKELSLLKNEETPTWSYLEEILREGARKMLQEAINKEVSDYLSSNKKYIDKNGHRMAVRNGFAPPREIQTGIGPLSIKKPRVDDRKLRQTQGVEGFTSNILPRFLRRVPSIDNLLPVLYLKGISSGDFSVALSAILGVEAKNVSSNTILRLRSVWEEEYQEWLKRDLSNKKYVYVWADGIYFNIRLEKERSCILVLIAADEFGNKELLAVSDGMRESKLSWKEILLDLKSRGLRDGPKLAIGDGSLGFWGALNEVYPETAEQRCWVHKTANILDKLPKSLQSKAKSSIHEMYNSPNKEDAFKVYQNFIDLYEDKYQKAVKCLTKSKDQLFSFYDFPAIHWIHIRTTNPIESTFSTVRHRTYKTRGCGNRNTTLTMVYKLVLESKKKWSKLKGHSIIPLVLEGVCFENGELQKTA